MTLSRALIITGLLYAGSPAFAGTKLWGSFEAGMTPQQVLDTAVAVPGVASAKIKQKRGAETVDVSHGMYSKFEAGGKKARLGFEFQKGVLFAVTITPEPYEFGLPGCIRGGVQAFRYYDELLSSKYTRKINPTPNLGDDDLNVMILRGQTATINKERYTPTVANMAAAYIDGGTLIVTRVRFSFFTLGLCGQQGNLHGSTEITYYDQAAYEAALAAIKENRSKSVDELSKSL